MSDDRSRLTNTLQMLDQAFSQLNARLTEIENRLSQLETEQQTQAILEEHRIVEGQGLLGGKTLLSSPRGGIQRLTHVMVCDACGLKMSEETDLTICHSCRRKLCESCIIRHENKSFCYECLKVMIPLTKKAYKILVCISKEITSIRTISELTHISKEEVRDSITYLLDQGLIEDKGIFFPNRKIVEAGIVTISAYRQAYNKDGDVTQFETELEEHLTEKLQSNVEVL